MRLFVFVRVFLIFSSAWIVETDSFFLPSQLNQKLSAIKFRNGQNKDFSSRSPLTTTTLITQSDRFNSFICYSQAKPKAPTESTQQYQQLNGQHQKKYKHILAILAMPYNSYDRIANEVILEKVLPLSRKVSIVLRCEGKPPSVATLRRYVGEVYSQLWDCAMAMDSREEDYAKLNTYELPDVIIYPQNLPNAAPEAWIDIQPDLDCICSHDFITGWTSSASIGSRGQQYMARRSAGLGGLKEHVEAINLERKTRNMAPVHALTIDGFLHHPQANQRSNEMDDDHVIYLDDEDECMLPFGEDDEPENQLILSGGIPSSENQLFQSVAVGGTFDGLHFGHRKLLTLAISSVHPITGRLLVGVTVDAMLRNKAYAEYIPTYEQRCAGVRKFLDRLAPGMINRVQVKPITDPFGPPGQVEADAKFKFDALVLSHETLATGYDLNAHRDDLGMKPLKLLCTRRTESHGMSSTALRRLRKEHHDHEQQQKQK